MQPNQYNYNKGKYPQTPTGNPPPSIHDSSYQSCGMPPPPSQYNNPNYPPSISTTPTNYYGQSFPPPPQSSTPTAQFFNPNPTNVSYPSTPQFSNTYPTSTPSNYYPPPPLLHLPQSNSGSNLSNRPLTPSLRPEPLSFSNLNKNYSQLSLSRESSEPYLVINSSTSTPRLNEQLSRSGSSTTFQTTSRINKNQVPRPEINDTDLIFNTYNVQYRTNPPTVNSSYFSIDNGNCLPKFCRSSFVAPPINKTLLDKTKLPFSLISTPFATLEDEENNIPLVSYGDNEDIPRCETCSGYINPFCQFLNEGNSWSCNLCGKINTVESWYYSSLMLNNNNKYVRLDHDVRPELNKGTVEFLANKNYDIKQEKSSGFSKFPFLFCIDLSYKSISEGLAQASIESIRNLIDYLVTQESNKEYNTLNYSINHNINNNAKSLIDVQIGIITFNSKIQFYQSFPSPNSLNQEIQEAGTLFIHEVDSSDPFFPIPSSILFLDAKKDYNRITSIINKIEDTISKKIQVYYNKYECNQQEELNDLGEYSNSMANYDDKEDFENCSLAVLKACESGLKKSGGKVFMFTSSHSTVGYGALSFPRESLNDSHFIKKSTTVHSSNLSNYNPYCNGSYEFLLYSSPLNLNKVNEPIKELSKVSSDKGKSFKDKINELINQTNLTINLTYNLIKNSISVTTYVSLLNLFTDDYTAQTFAPFTLHRFSSYESTKNQITSSLFVDTVSLSKISTETGGKIHSFKSNLHYHSEKSKYQFRIFNDFYSLFYRNVKMKLRLSSNIELDSIIGPGVEVKDLNFTLNNFGDSPTTQNTQSLDSPSRYYYNKNEYVSAILDSSSSFLFNLKYTNSTKLENNSEIYAQLALLYVNEFGKKVIRVHNLCLRATNSYNSIYKNIDTEVVAATFFKNSVLRALQNPLCHNIEDIAEFQKKKANNLPLKTPYTVDRFKSKYDKCINDYLKYNLINVLLTYAIESSNYKSSTNLPSPTTQLVLPDGLKSLPVYILSILKSSSLIPNCFDSRLYLPSNSPAHRYSSTATIAPPPTIYGSNQPINSSLNIQKNSIHSKYEKNLYYLTHDRLISHPSERSIELHNLVNLSLKETVNSSYPRLYNLFALLDSQFNYLSMLNSSNFIENNEEKLDDKIESNFHELNTLTMNNLLASLLIPSAETIEQDQIYLLLNGTNCYLYIGKNVPNDVIFDLFYDDTYFTESHTAASFAALPPYLRPQYVSLFPSTFSAENASASYNIKEALTNLIKFLYENSSINQEIRIVWENNSEFSNLRFTTALIDDANEDIQSYMDFLCGVHSIIKKLR